MDFVPAVYEHAARFVGERPWTVSRDGELLARAHAEAWRCYRHAPVVVGIDIYNLEAEAYGAEIAEPEGDGLPAVVRHPCGSLEDLAALAPFDPTSARRIPMVIDAARRVREACPGADVRVPVSGPFSIAVSLMGFEPLLCEVLTRPDAARGALEHLARGGGVLCEAVRDAGLDIAFFESAASPPLLSPDLFRTVELPALREILGRAAEIMGHPVPCIIGGDTAPILEDILSTGTGYVICPSETDQAAFLDAMKSHPEVTVRASMPPEVLAAGPPEAIRAGIDRLIKLVDGRPNTCLGAGVVPYEAPPENVLLARDYAAAKA